jgi:signal transduction histidine kinase/ActR/RegA family two-component response regulator
MKVRAYLVLTAAAILVPVVIFSTLALGMLLNAERAAALRGLHETARATALSVDRELAAAEAALRVLSVSARLHNNDMPGFYDQAKSADRGPGAWTVLINEQGQQVVNTGVSYGTPLAPTPEALASRAAQVIKDQKMLVSNLITGPVTGKPVTTINLPLPDLPYILAATMTPDFFNRTIAQPQVPSNWIIGLIDRNGRFIARSHKAAELVGQPARPELVAAAGGAHSGEIRHSTVEGTEVYDAFTHSSVSGWIVAVAAPVEHIEWSARRAVTVAAVGMLAALLCAAAAAIFFGRRLLHSLTGARMAAAALGRGEPIPDPLSGVAEVDQLQLALRDAGRQLSSAQEDRARLLASEQEARQIAEEQNKAKDTFLAMLGHELRNPLSAISGAIAVIDAAGPGSDMAERARAIIARQSQHLERIIEDLLDAARMLTGKISLIRKPLDLGEAVRTCVASLQATGQTEGYAIHVETESLWLNADPTRIDQIINNLVFNALKYTPRGGSIDVSVTRDDGHAVLEIKDTGVGIEAELLPNLFAPFVQGASSIDRAQGGLGIGLTMVRRLAELHGGSAHAASEGPGLGSTFTVRLPLTRIQLDGAAAPPAPAANGAGLTILLVEDNADARAMIATVLSLHGYRVLEAGASLAGLELAGRQAIDAAVVDIGLPDIDGHEFARRMRAATGTAGIALIALTGYGLEADARRAFAAGFDAHLVKPVNTSELMQVIRETVNRRRAAS